MAKKESSANLQDTFLNHIRKQKIPVTAFLLNGVKLQGIVTWFDNFCVLLKRDQYTQLIYKHAISTIMPSKPVQLYTPDGEEMTDGNNNNADSDGSDSESAGA